MDYQLTEKNGRKIAESDDISYLVMIVDKITEHRCEECENYPAYVITSNQTGELLREWDSYTPIMPENLSVRAYNCLRRKNITTVEQLTSLSIDDIFSIRNAGGRAVAEILAFAYNNKQSRYDMSYNLTSFASLED